MRCGSLEEELIGQQLPVKDVALRQREHVFEIGRQQHLHIEDAAREAGREFIHNAEHVTHEGLAMLGPGSTAQLVGRVSAEHVDDVLSRRGEGVVDERGDDGGDERTLRIAAVLGVVVRALEIIDARPDVDVARVREARLGGVECAITRSVVARGIDLEGGRERAEAVDLRHEVLGQLRAPDEPLNRNLALRFEITARAGISSPEARTTPRAAPSRTITEATAELVRASRPNRAPDAMIASEIAPCLP
jgi:hypothetical protein